MAGPDYDPLDEAEEGLAVNPGRRKTTRAVGCVFLLLIVGLLLWFGITHRETVENRGFLGMVPQAEQGIVAG